MVESAARQVRRHARQELTARIVTEARRQLATEGAAGLSLRAVARELGMVSSAVYRYVASRDELLTLMIIEAYDAIGAAAERAEARVPREDLPGRSRAVCLAVRRWALAHPHEYALIFGSPVPGYRAPQDTITPATRVPALLIGILHDLAGSGPLAPAVTRPLDPATRRAIGPVRASVPEQVPDELLVRGLIAWTHLLGAVSMELFGHWNNVIGEPAGQREAFFEAAIGRVAALVMLGSGASAV
jgi:AcrR family transcriptional regulator